VHEPVNAEGRTVTVESWQPLVRVFSVGPGPATDARLALFYYPHWIATAAGGQVLPVRPGPDGAVLVSLPPDAATVTVAFREPPRVAVARYAAVGTWILLAVLLGASLWRRPQQSMGIEPERTERKE
jgi:hypothetical protein